MCKGILDYPASAKLLIKPRKDLQKHPSWIVSKSNDNCFMLLSFGAFFSGVINNMAQHSLPYGFLFSLIKEAVLILSSWFWVWS